MSTFETDQFYYIMDYSCNYYRVDSMNQLVAVGNENDATVFSFSEADKRIGSGGKSKFYYMTPVEMQKEDSQDWEQVHEQEEIYDQIETNVSAVRELTAAEIPEDVEKSISEYDLSKMDWQEYITHFTFIAAGIKEYRESLIKAESDVDQKVCDVLHYIELCDTSQDEAADLVELLRVCRENRRDIKDEILRVDTFQRNLGTSANVAKAKETLKAIKGLEKRKYVPRKFSELFEGSEIKSRPRSDRCVADSLVSFRQESMNSEYSEEEPQMEYTRQETVFDGKEHDWMAFAIQQAEFYRNVGQYIANIQMDINEIDGAISDLMDQIEVANCNVTQGYKMFKNLKELRLEKKKKEKELECLYILTDHFDINAMAEEYENELEELETLLEKN